MRHFLSWMETIGSDDLQNEVILILHHVHDVEQALRQGQSEYALAGLKDIRESAERLARTLTARQQTGVHRTEGG